MGLYLYGGSIKGIHEYIAKTNKLREIVGASYLLQEIENFIDSYRPKEIYVKAAANIKALFDDEDQIKKAVMNMPKRVMQSAYGVTFVQAVIPIEGDHPSEEDFEKLEEALAAQRNRLTPAADLALGIVNKSPRTARPAIEEQIEDNQKVLIDLATQQKRSAYTDFFAKEREEDSQIVEKKELSDLTNSKNKYALIHADGNGLGTIIPRYIRAGHKLQELSQKLDSVTKAAYEEAKKVVQSQKIRKLFLSGDDLLVIVDPDYALEFTKAFLEQFEILSEREQVTKGVTPKLTACAGIVFVNEKYPFHYGLHLAEELGKAAKKVSKSLVNPEEPAPSSLLFHNIQSGHYDSYSQIVENELTLPYGHQFDFGPYFLHSQTDLPTIDDLMELWQLFEQEDAPLTKLRGWITTLRQNEAFAQLQLDRIHEIAKSKWSGYDRAMEILEKMGIDPKKMFDTNNKSVLYDILQLHAVSGE